ncbi:MAG: hypothetical protein JXA95_06425 [Spirochaetales bacterium]|nr:hypothetical protein [Spirochaetales bacterium]
MKRVFSLTAVFMAVLFISSCTPFSTIPKVEFTFVNNLSETVDITPQSGTGQDWTGFTLSASGGTQIIESENSNIYFNAYIGSAVTPTHNYDTDNSTHTFTFNP